MLRIALLGAECTGKTTLSQDLVTALRSRGQSCTVVDEYLRRWCEQHGRTPRSEEQAAIAQEQSQRIEQAQASDWLIADTTALTTAIYSDMYFGDRSLHDMAVAAQRGFDLTLLAATDLHWLANGLQRDGPERQMSYDRLMRETLTQSQIPYRVIYGGGPERLRNALACLISLGLEPVGDEVPAPSRWRWNCEKCSDPDCEHRLFADLLRARGRGAGSD